MAKGGRGIKNAPPPERPTRQSRRLHRDENGTASPLQQLPSPHRPARAKKNTAKRKPAASNNGDKSDGLNNVEPQNALTETTQMIEETPLPPFSSSDSHPAASETVSPPNGTRPSATLLKESHNANVLSSEDEGNVDEEEVTYENASSNGAETSENSDEDNITLVDREVSGEAAGVEEEEEDEVGDEEVGEVEDEEEEIRDGDDVEISSSHSSQSDKYLSLSAPPGTEPQIIPDIQSDLITTPPRHTISPQYEVSGDAERIDVDPDSALYTYIRPRGLDVGNMSETEAANSKEPSPSPSLSASSFDSLFDEPPMHSPHAAEVNVTLKAPFRTPLASHFDISPVTLSSAGVSHLDSGRCGEHDDAVPRIDLNKRKHLIPEIGKLTMDPQAPIGELHNAIRKVPNALEFFKDLVTTGESLNTMDNLLFGPRYTRICFDTKLKLLFIDRFEIMSNGEQLDVATALYSQGIGLTEANKRLKSHNKTAEEELKATKAALEAREAELEDFRRRLKELEQTPRQTTPKQKVLIQTPSNFAASLSNSHPYNTLSQKPKTGNPLSSKKRSAPVEEDSEFMLSQRAAHRIRYEKRKALGESTPEVAHAHTNNHASDDDLDEAETSNLIDTPKAYENAVNKEYKKVLKSRFMDRENEDRPFMSHLSSNKKTPRAATPHRVNFASPFASDVSPTVSTPTQSAHVAAPQTPQPIEPVSSWRLGSLIGSVSKIPQYLFGRRTNSNEPGVVAPQTAPVQRVRNSITSQEDIDRIFKPPSTPTPGIRRNPNANEDLPDRILEQAILATKSRPVSSDYKRFLVRKRPQMRHSQRRSLLDAEEKKKEAAEGAKLAAKEAAMQARRNGEIEEMAHQPGDKRKRVKINDLKHIPNPAGCSYGLDPDFFDHGSDSEPEIEVDEEVSLLTPPPAKRVRFTDDTYSSRSETNFVPPPPSPHSKVAGDPFHARPYAGRMFSASPSSNTLASASPTASKTIKVYSPFYSDPIYTLPDFAEHFGNLFATSQIHHHDDLTSNDPSIAKNDPNYNHSGSFEVPDDSDTESERLSILDSPTAPRNISPSKSASTLSSKKLTGQSQPTANIFASASGLSSAVEVEPMSGQKSTAIEASPIFESPKTPSSHSLVPAGPGKDSNTQLSLESQQQVGPASVFSKNQSPISADIKQFTNVLKKDQENNVREKEQAVKDAAIASVQRKQEQLRGVTTAKGAELAEDPTTEQQIIKQPSPPNENGAVSKEHGWIQSPPPKPIPAHSSLPATQQTAANGNDFDALARARSQAEKYKPKQPSGLRSSSKLSTSAGGPHNTADDSELADSQNYGNSVPQANFENKPPNHATSESVFNGVDTADRSSVLDRHTPLGGSTMSLVEWDEIVAEAIADDARLPRIDTGIPVNTKLSKTELDEVLKHVANVPEELLVSRYTFDEALKIPCDEEVAIAIKKAEQSSGIRGLQQKWGRVLMNTEST